MKVVDIAQEIYFDLNSPSDLSIAALSYWLRSNVGKLNSLVFGNFSVNESYEIVDGDNNNEEIDINAAAIMKKMYMINRYAVILRSKLTDLGTDDVIEVKDQDTSVRRTDKNLTIRSITAEKKQEEDELRYLINAYRAKKSAPKQVVGDDIIPGKYPEYNPSFTYSRTYGYTAF
jgi:hypothetical protein